MADYFNPGSYDKRRIEKQEQGFCYRTIKLPKSDQTDDIDRIIIRLLTRFATSVAANYRSALKAESRKDFCYKINIVEEEADESYFWLELIAGAGIVAKEKLQLLIKESCELAAIFTAQGNTAKLNLNKY